MFVLHIIFSSHHSFFLCLNPPYVDIVIRIGFRVLSYTMLENATKLNVIVDVMNGYIEPGHHRVATLITKDGSAVGKI